VKKTTHLVVGDAECRKIIILYPCTTSMNAALSGAENRIMQRIVHRAGGRCVALYDCRHLIMLQCIPRCFFLHS